MHEITRADGIRRFVARATQWVTTLWANLLDRRARHRVSGALLPDVWALALAVLASAGTFIEGWHRLGGFVPWIPPSVEPLVLSLAGLAWCLYVIGAVENSPHALAPSRYDESLYKYRSGVRQLCKVSLVALSLAVISFAAKTLDDLSPLPLVFYGELRDQSGAPVPSVLVTVDILDNNVTDWQRSIKTDDDGYYKIQTTLHLRHTARLSAHCGQAVVPLSLNRSFESADKPKRLLPSDIFFRHTIECEAHK